MSTDPLIYVMAAAAVVGAIALVMQALMLLGVYKSSKATHEQVTLISVRVESFFDSTGRAVEQSRKQLAEVTAKAGEVLDLTHKQLVRIDDFLGEVTSRAQVQMDRVELILDDTMSRLHETAVLLNKGVLRPIREVNAVAAGIQAALSALFRGQRLSVEQATHDEEMFI
jgi:phage-related minor tail protein